MIGKGECAGGDLNHKPVFKDGAHDLVQQAVALQVVGSILISTSAVLGFLGHDSINL